LLFVTFAHQKEENLDVEATRERVEGITKIKRYEKKNKIKRTKLGSRKG